MSAVIVLSSLILLLTLIMIVGSSWARSELDRLHTLLNFRKDQVDDLRTKISNQTLEIMLQRERIATLDKQIVKLKASKKAKK